MMTLEILCEWRDLRVRDRGVVARKDHSHDNEEDGAGGSAGVNDGLSGR